MEKHLYNGEYFIHRPDPQKGRTAIGSYNTCHIGTFITASGFTYHGPTKSIGFAPKLNKGNFKSAFTTAEGWGTYWQLKNGKQQEHDFEQKYGRLRIQNIWLEKPEKVRNLALTIDKSPMEAEIDQNGIAVQVRFAQPVTLAKGQMLAITL